MFGLIKWLKNRKIKSIIKIDNGNFQIELEDGGDAKISNELSVKLFSFFDIRKKTEAIIKTPLSKDGVNKVAFQIDDKITQEIDAGEKEYFSTPQITEETIDDRELDVSLQLVDISFRQEGKWKFNDGASIFFAELTDKDFLYKIQNNQIVFAKDDILKTKIKRKQLLSNGVIKTEYSVIKVLEHRSGATQITLPFTDQIK